MMSRDVLVMGKRLAKERDEMCRQMGRLYEDVTSLHQVITCSDQLKRQFIHVLINRRCCSS